MHMRAPWLRLKEAFRDAIKLLGTHQSVESKVYKEYESVSEKETPERKMGKQEE